MGEFGYQVSGNAAENYERVASAFMMPWAQHLIEQSRLAEGERVLDLACGTGFVARVAAGIVGADRVVGVDVNPMMLAVAQTATGIEVRERPADDTGLDDGSVDVVFELTEHRLDIDLPSMEEFFPALISATPWAATFDELSDSEQRAVVVRMNDAVGQRADGNGTTATMTVIVAEGTVG